MEQPVNANTLAGTIGGTLLVLCLKISLEEIAHTALLALIGAVVSFSVSVVMKVIINRFKKRVDP